MYGGDMMLKLLFAPTTVTRPTSVQIALSRTIPPRNAMANQLVEPSGTGVTYARQSIALDATHWAPTGFGSMYNRTKVAFPKVTTALWGLVVGWALVDPNNSQLLAAGPLSVPVQTTQGMVPILDAGTIILGVDI